MSLAERLSSKFHICPPSFTSRPNVHFFGQSLSRGHYQPTYPPPEGVYLLNIHEPEVNNCFTIITQVIIEIPKQRNVIILPQFAVFDKSSYHAARINVSRNAFSNSRSKEKNIFFDVYTR